MLSDADVEFVDRQYGKDYVRLLQVKREGPKHFIKEIEVNTKLTLSDDRDFLQGDNSRIIATDTQKNTVYILAKQFGIKNIEEFAGRLVSHFINQYSWVNRARVYIEEKPWKRITQGGVPHNHAFVAGGYGTHFCEVEQIRNEAPHYSSGIKDLKIMKTTQSAFVNFVNDEYRSLPDMDDRIFCTVVYAKWDYRFHEGVNFDRTWETVSNIIFDVFAGPPEKGVFSPSVQKTLYDTQKLVISKISAVDKIFIELPNVHAYEYDFSKFKKLGLKNEGEIFQPTDKPSGNIQSLVRRKLPSKL